MLKKICERMDKVHGEFETGKEEKKKEKKVNINEIKSEKFKALVEEGLSRNTLKILEETVKNAISSKEELDSMLSCLEKYKRDERVLEELCYWIKEFKKSEKPLSEFFKLFSSEEVVNLVFKFESVDMPRIMANEIATIAFYIGNDEALLASRVLSNFKIFGLRREISYRLAYIASSIKDKEMFYKAIKIFSSEEFIKVISECPSDAISDVIKGKVAHYTGLIISYTNDEKAAETFLHFVSKFFHYENYEKLMKEANRVVEVAIETKNGKKVIKEIKKLEEQKTNDK
jgi:hypothetical protein